MRGERRAHKQITIKQWGLERKKCIFFLKSFFLFNTSRPKFNSFRPWQFFRKLTSLKTAQHLWYSNILCVSSTKARRLHPRIKDKHYSPPYSRVSHSNTTQTCRDLSYTRPSWMRGQKGKVQTAPFSKWDNNPHMIWLSLRCGDLWRTTETFWFN